MVENEKNDGCNCNRSNYFMHFNNMFYFWKMYLIIKESVKTSEANLNISDMKGTIPRVALTFDDGPSTKYTEKLLKGLKKRESRQHSFLQERGFLILKR